MQVARFRTLFVLIAILIPWFAHADEAGNLRQYVVTNTQQMMDRLKENKDLYQTDPGKFYKIMDDTLGSFVDFRLIAARVMGRYVRQATPSQRHEFLEKFKHSLFDSYAKPLVEAKDYSIHVKEVQINPHDPHRASVQLEVHSASGNTYPVVYSMHQNDQGKWLLENIIVEGVNIGLAFRDRFAQDMENNRGNIESVIQNWSGKVKELEKKNATQQKTSKSS